jgi:hypothetical protein
MPSARRGDGSYEVIGTSGACVVTPILECFGAVRTIWQLTRDGQHVRSFSRKRDALIYCQEHPEL